MKQEDIIKNFNGRIKRLEEELLFKMNLRLDSCDSKIAAISVTQNRMIKDIKDELRRHKEDYNLAHKI